MDLPGADKSRRNDVTAFLNSIISSSEEARELVMQMLAYRNANESFPSSPSSPSTPSAPPLDDNNVTAVVQHVVNSLRREDDGALRVNEDLEAGLVVRELKAAQLRKLLLQLFRITRPSFLNGDTLDIKLRLRDYNDQACACCYQAIDGFFIEIVVQDAEMESRDADGNKQPLLHLANDLSGEQNLLDDISRLHAALAELNGHIMVHADEYSRKSWHLVMEASGSLSVESRASLENFRRQRKNK